MLWPVSNYLKWKTKGFSHQSIKPAAASNNSIAPALSWIDTETRVNFDGSWLTQGKLTFTHKQVVNIYIVYEIHF